MLLTSYCTTAPGRVVGLGQPGNLQTPHLSQISEEPRETFPRCRVVARACKHAGIAQGSAGGTREHSTGGHRTAIPRLLLLYLHRRRQSSCCPRRPDDWRPPLSPPLRPVSSLRRHGRSLLRQWAITEDQALHHLVEWSRLAQRTYVENIRNRRRL